MFARVRMSGPQLCAPSDDHRQLDALPLTASSLRSLDRAFVLFWDLLWERMRGSCGSQHQKWI